MGVLDDAADPVPVANFPHASVDDIESAISEDNCETTIVQENVRIGKNDDKCRASGSDER